MAGSERHELRLDGGSFRACLRAASGEVRVQDGEPVKAVVNGERVPADSCSRPSSLD
jgi:hypothetical protein